MELRKIFKTVTIHGASSFKYIINTAIQLKVGMKCKKVYNNDGCKLKGYHYDFTQQEFIVFLNDICKQYPDINYTITNNHIH